MLKTNANCALNRTEEIKIISVMLLFHGSNTNIHFSLVRAFREKLYSAANGNCDCRDIGLGDTFRMRSYVLKQEHFHVLHVNRNFNGTWDETLTWAKYFRLEIRLKAIFLITRSFDYRHLYKQGDFVPFKNWLKMNHDGKNLQKFAV